MWYHHVWSLLLSPHSDGDLKGVLEGKVDMTAEVPLGIIQNTGIRTERSTMSGVRCQEGTCFVFWRDTNGREGRFAATDFAYTRWS